VGVAVGLMKRYRGLVAHDATGVGDVIGDLFPEDAHQHSQIHGEVMRGEARSQMFSEYIRAIESGTFKAPRIQFAFEEHLYCSYEALFAASGHPPDSVVSGSMAWLFRGHEHVEIDVAGLGQPGNAWQMEAGYKRGIPLVSSGWSV
jgi:hypothetical protein